MSKRLTLNDFISKSEKVHGVGTYDYSKVDYVNARTKVKIICSKHGSFSQAPYKHLVGQNCPTCSGNHQSNTKEFLVKSVETHGTRYDYSLVSYINSVTKIKIICNEHGIFQQTPADHLSGKGCSKCGINRRADARRKTARQFKIEARKINGEQYDYSLSEYVNNKTKIEIICFVHGSFLQRPNDHLKGKGCPKCGSESAAFKQSSSTEDFIEKAIVVHGRRYNYSPTNYIKRKERLQIVCKKHGLFWQTPEDHLRGRGCPSCSISGFKTDKPAILYYLNIEDGQAYKIGITNNDVKSRFAGEADKIKIIKTWNYQQGSDALYIEQYILNKFKINKYQGAPLLRNGNTELFNCDILSLDK